jgi:thiamine kinase-like enzyme
MKTIIGKGHTSEVYKEDDRAYKIYPFDFPLEVIEEELRVNQIIAQHTQLPMDPLVATDSPYVLQMKFFGMETLTSKMLNREKNVVEDLVNLQMSVFQYRDLPLHNIHERYHRRISASQQLTQEQKNIALRVLSELAYQPTLAHMDFHPNNLIFYDGQYWILDWVNAGCANPLLCIARTYILLHYHAQRRAQKYLSYMSKKNGWSKQLIREVAIIQAAHRITETDDPWECGFMSAYIKEVGNL